MADNITPMQFLDETVKYYKTHKRGIKIDPSMSVSGPVCTYFYRNKVCAVGRCLINPKRFKSNQGDVYDLFSTYPKEHILKPEYVHLSTGELEIIQDLHDRNIFWIPTKRGNKLSELGVIHYETLKKTFESYEA